MEAEIGKSRLVLKRGDITREKADAIVNAANTSLLGGGGVDGAIHKVGGPAILEQTRKLGGCQPGDAKITTGGNLPAKWVIHTVGPIWKGGGKGEDETLESAYRRSLEVAVENGARTVSFPSVSTGVYGFPVDRAALIALQTIVRFLWDHQDALDQVSMVLFSEQDLGSYQQAMSEIMESANFKKGLTRHPK